MKQKFRLNCVVEEDYKSLLNFREVTNNVLDVLPQKDLIGIEEVIYGKCKDKVVGGKCIYSQNGRKSKIKICVNNLFLYKYIDEYLGITEFLCLLNREIAALILSSYISHEVGHHVHRFHRHNIKKKGYENFAKLYSKAGSYRYYKSRQKKITRSFKKARYLYIIHSREEREYYKKLEDKYLKLADKEPEFP